MTKKKKDAAPALSAVKSVSSSAKASKPVPVRLSGLKNTNIISESMDGCAKPMDGIGLGGNDTSHEADVLEDHRDASSPPNNLSMMEASVNSNLGLECGPEDGLLDGMADGLAQEAGSEGEIFEGPLAKKSKKNGNNSNDENVDDSMDIKDDTTENPKDEDKKEDILKTIKSLMNDSMMKKINDLTMDDLVEGDKESAWNLFFFVVKLFPTVLKAFISLEEENQRLKKKPLQYNTIASMNAPTPRRQPISPPVSQPAPQSRPVLGHNPNALTSFVRKEPRQFSIIFVRGLGTRRISHLKNALWAAGIDTRKIFNIDYIGKSIIEFHVLSDFKEEFCRILKEKVNVQVQEANPLNPQFCPTAAGSDASVTDATKKAAELCKSRIEARITALQAATRAPRDHLNYLNAIKRAAEAQLDTGLFENLSYNARPMRIGRANTVAFDAFWSPEDLGKSSESVEITHSNDQ